MKNYLAGVLFLSLFFPALSFGQPPTSMHADKILDVVGTDRPETIRVGFELVGGRRFIQVLQVTITDDLGRVTRQTYQPWDYWDKELIRIDAKDGSDVIIVDVDLDCWIYCGKGHDTVFSGSGDDLIQGEDGGDILFGGPGSDVLDGGNSGLPMTNWLDGEEGLDRFAFNYFDTVEDLTYEDDDVDLFGSYSIWGSGLPPAHYFDKVKGRSHLSEYPYKYP